MIAQRQNLRHLRAFCIVAETHNVSRAAERIHLSQPAITQAIHKLEAQFDIVLFERNKHGLYATEAGDMLRNRVETAFNLLEDGIIFAGRRAQKPDAKKAIHLITTTQLRSLTAISEAKSFAIAARKMKISQSSLHRTARDLESLLGIEFFNASHKGIVLTEPAAILARHALLAEAELRQADYEIRALKGMDSTRIVVGSMPLSRTTILPDAVQALLNEQTQVQVRNVDGPYAELLHKLRHGEIDFLVGATRNPVPTDDVVQEMLFSDPLSVITGSHHPLVNKQGIKLIDTLNYPWISPPRSAPAGERLANLLGLAEEESSASPIRVISSSLVMIRGLLMRGEHLTLMSPRQMQVELDLGLLKILDVDLPDTGRPIGLTFRKGWSPTRTQSRFIDLVREAANNALINSHN